MDLNEASPLNAVLRHQFCGSRKVGGAGDQDETPLILRGLESEPAHCVEVAFDAVTPRPPREAVVMREARPPQ
jgi:hypothetical protein